MPTNFSRFINGVPRNTANDGIPVSSMDGDGGGIVDIAVVTIGQNAGNSLPVSDPTITLQLFPFGAATVGTDINGNISVLQTWTRTPPPENFYDPTGPTTGQEFVDGFFGQDVRAVINLTAAEVPAGLDFFIQIQCRTEADFTPDAGDSPVTDLTASDISWDEENEEGAVTLSWNHSGADQYLIEYSFDGVTWNPWAATPNLTYRDTSYVSTTTIYRVIPVNTTTNTIPTATPPTVTVVFTGAPSLSVTMDGGIDLGGAAVMSFQGDPSGLYTLVPGKRNDTLYERVGAEDTVDVAIPRPYFKMGFVP